MWTYETRPNYVLKGNGHVSCAEFDDPIEGFVRLGVNGWVHVTDHNDKTHSLSPALALEIVWKGKFPKDEDDK